MINSPAHSEADIRKRVRERYQFLTALQNHVLFEGYA